MYVCIIYVLIKKTKYFQLGSKNMFLCKPPLIRQLVTESLL